MTKSARHQVGGGAVGTGDEGRVSRAASRWRGLALAAAALPLFGALSAPAFAASATRVSAFEYDAATGLLTKEIIEPDQTQFRLETLYTYDAFGNKLTATISSPAGGQAAIVSRTSTNTYTANGRFVATSANALNHTETKTYDDRFGAPLTLTGPNNLTTTWEYDSFGRKTLETRADGTKTKFEYLYCSGVAGGTATCPALAKFLVQGTPLAANGTTQIGPWSKVYSDVLGREIRSETQGYDGPTASPNILKDTVYDSKGRVEKASRPYFVGTAANDIKWTAFAYDAIGRVLTETDPDNSTTQNTYAGLVATATNALSQTKTTTKNSQGQVVQVKDHLNNTTGFAYDPFGNLTATTDAAANVTTLTYDIRGRKTAMSDPDMGSWSYVYDVLGQLVQQTDAKSQVSTIAYDKLGRLTSRTEVGLTSTWIYDTATKGVGKLASTQASNGYLQTQIYDSLGRATQTLRWIDQPVLDPGYNSETSYDANGRAEVLTYPSGFKVQYVYTALGYLKEARKDNASGDLLWQAIEIDAQGHLKQQKYGNNVVTTQTYDANTALLTGIAAGPVASPTSVQNLSYQWDALTNLTQRGDATQNLVENFTYDSLNRLTGSTAVDAPSLTKTIQYNAIGNITYKSDVGTYTYNASGASSVRPHALASVTGTLTATYTYDANGNLLTGAGRTVTYTSFNMPATIARGAVSISFDYDSGHARTKQVAPDGTTIYLGPSTGHHAEKLISPTNVVRWTSYIHAGGGMIGAYYEQSGGGSGGQSYAGSDNHSGQTITGTASTADTVIYPHPRSYYTIVTNNSGSYYGNPVTGPYYEISQTNGGIDSVLYIERAQFTDQTIDLATGLPVSATPTTYLRYFHKDHLGSISVITDAAGVVTERLSYDAWGKRRFPTGADDTGETITSSTDRGFTGHEHLEFVGLIHMNGRVYDPVIGRFMSADPFIQDPSNTQSLNRYTYVINNPLALTDPSGFFSFSKFFKAVFKFSYAPTIRNWYNHIKYGPGQEYIDKLLLKFPLLQSAAVVAATIISAPCGGCAGWAVAAYTAGLNGGSSFDMFKAAVFTAASSYAGGISDVATRVVVSAAIGGISSAVNDGNFASGFLAAGFSSLAGAITTNLGADNIVTRAAIGGTSSVIGGGKFKNGAMTAAFNYVVANAISFTQNYAAMERKALEDSLMLPIQPPGAGLGRAALWLEAFRLAYPISPTADATMDAAGLRDLAQFRSELGLKEGVGTLARLEIGDKVFYGISAHGQDVDLVVNAQSRYHAEGDVFQQAKNAGVSSEFGVLTVDNKLCDSCGIYGGVKGMARQVGIKSLRVVTPGVVSEINP